ncbi:FadR/GntR family transcriptional regulator [Dermabacteraceae bacterium P13115]|nr:FCD domain-containing protein [Dermabacteraceae bacterium TAE3-ERU5]
MNDAPSSRFTEILETVGPEIVSGENAPGTALTLAGIEERFSCSRTVAREVQRRLEGLGLVRAQRRIGLTVLPREEWAVFDPAIIRWRLSGPDRARQLESLTALRLAIEPQAVSSAARFASKQQRQEILDAGLRVVALGAEGSGEEFMRADIAFHTMILAYSGNEMFAALSPVVESVLTWRTEVGLMPPHPEPRAMEDHRRIAVEIYRGNPQAAAAAMRDLVDEVQEAFAEIDPSLLGSPAEIPAE